MKRYLDKEERYQADKKKLYNLVWGQCTEMMKNELEIVKEYDEMKKKQDPLMLLRNIKAITYNFRDQKYLPGSMWRAYKSVYNLTMREDEDTTAYYESFKNQVTVVENYGGTIGQDQKLYENEDIYQKMNNRQQDLRTNIDAAKERARDQFLAFGFLANCDKKRFGDVVNDLDNMFTFGDDKYPRTLQKAHEYLKN